MIIRIVIIRGGMAYYMYAYINWVFSHEFACFKIFKLSVKISIYINLVNNKVMPLSRWLYYSFIFLHYIFLQFCQYLSKTDMIFDGLFAYYFFYMSDILCRFEKLIINPSFIQ